MLREFRDWLESELKLLGNASHHAYAFGQANMAKRALEKFDAELERAVYVSLSPPQARAALVAIEALRERSAALPPELENVRSALATALEAWTA